jgi:hypothetical protein
MKAISLIISLLGGSLAAAVAQNSFRATLTPVVPTPENSWITGTAGFALNGNSVNFTISFGLEDIVPMAAHLTGPDSELAFDLGPPFITLHSPGPWPHGYDGSTAFFGSFVVSDQLRDDLMAGHATLHLLRTRVGDFSGAVLPASPPQIAQLSRQGSELQVHFRAEAPYQYTVESIESFGTTNTLSLEKVLALSQTFDVVVTNSINANGARFYRIRRELCCH